MITQPTTSQLLLDVIEELEREVLPVLKDEALGMRVQMVFATLRQCAARADREIATMREESADCLAYAAEVLAITGDPAIASAIDAATPGDDLRLVPVSRDYERAGEAMALAIERALDARQADLVAAGERILLARMAAERGLSELATVGR